MTFDVPPAVLLPLVGGALVAVTGYVVRAMVLDRIKALEASRDKLGARIGVTEGRLDAFDAVENYRHRRKMTTPGGHRGEDETPA